MNPEEYAIMYHVEDHHWWYRGMERITRTVLDRWYQSVSDLRILDAGCGTGAGMLHYLGDYGQVTSFDIASEALKFCQLRGLKRLARASALAIPFKSQSFDLITSFDVLCERAIPDDLIALQEFHRLLVAGGRVLLRLPALKWLGGRHDQAVHIARRYNRQEVIDRLEASGFAVQQISYANTILMPIVMAKRWSERIIPSRQLSSDLTLKVGPAERILRAVLAFEAPHVAQSRLPIGVSLVAVGQKI